MNLSKFFIDRPIFAGVLSVLIFVAGLIALRVLPIAEYPEVVPPSVVVRAQYPGANPKVIAETVATPLEESDQRRRGHALHGQPGDDRRPDAADRHVPSRHRPRQRAAAGAEPRRAGRAAAARGRAPARRHDGEERRPTSRWSCTWCRRTSATTRCTCATTRCSTSRTGWRASTASARCSCSAAATTAMRVWLDPHKVAERGLSAGDVVRAIREQNVQAAAGVLGALAEPAGIDLQLSINAQGRLQSEEEFGDIVVKSGADGEVTRLRDVARLELGAADYALRSLLDNKPAVGDRHLPGARTPTRSQISRRRPRAPWPSSSRTCPRAWTTSIVYDPTQFVRDSIEAVVHTLLEAVALVVLVVILFLQTWRASIIPLLAVPVSIVGTFAAMYAARLLDQRAQPVRAGARDRHRGRRRDRGGRERRAQHRGAG